MIEVGITNEMIEFAKLKDTHGPLKDSVMEGERNLIGYVGEQVFAKAFPHSDQVNTFDYDFTSNGKTIDVKTRTVKVRPPRIYSNNVYAYNTKQQCDYYVFCHVLENLTKGWLVGWMEPAAYFMASAFIKKGSRMPCPGNVIAKGDSYCLENQYLNQFPSRSIE